MAMPLIDRIRAGVDRLKAAQRAPVAVVVSQAFAAREGLHATDIDLGDVKLPIEYVEGDSELSLKSVEAAPVMESL